MATSQTNRPQHPPVWEDAFEQDGLPDPEFWAYESGVWRNGEAQAYTAGDPETARIEDGRLILQAHRTRTERSRHPGEFAEYRSASIYSKTSWTCGYFEVRARLPKGRGVWPAIWMMPDAPSPKKWPDCGEIDLMEYVGWDPQRIHASVHTAAYNHRLDTHKTGTIQLEAPWEDFHTYALDWTENRLSFFVDGRRYFTYADPSGGHKTWPFDQAFRLKINLAVGGTWGGKEGIDENAFPCAMEVDSVRVWQ